MRQLGRYRSVSMATVVAFAGLLSASCGRGPRLYPVQGQVMYAGQPAAGALVVFHPVAETDPAAPLPSGTVQADGTYTLSTYPLGEGAPSGDYRVAIVWIDKDKADPLTGEAPNRLPARYGDPSTSQLIASVQKGKTAIPLFALTK